MKVRQLIQVLVFPKSFNVLSFYSKGNYCLRIKLILENKSSGNCITAFPTLIQGKQVRREQQKKAKVNTIDGYYETEHFFVTFSEEKIVFNSGCIFKVEYQQGEQYNTYLDFQIAYSSAKKKTANDGVQPIKIDRIVDKRRLYVNSYNSLNKFKRVLFDDSDYFSYTDVLFISQSFGQKVRFQDYQFGQFQGSDLKTRQKYGSLAFDKWAQTNYKTKCMILTDSFDTSLQKFYSKMILQKVLRYRKLCQIYQKYRFMMSTLNNSTLSTAPALDHMEWIKVNQTLRESQIFQMYQNDDKNQIFMMIYQESQTIIRNVKYVWKLLIDLIVTVNFNLMEEMAAKQIEEERVTKNKWLLAYSDIIHDEIDQKRSEFVRKRKEIVSKMDIYEDHDIHHPFLIIENFEPSTPTPRNQYQIDSLVILVHGYQGSSVDLEKARNYMNIYSPHSYGLLIKTIEDDIDNPIQELGQTVAQQIRLHILNSMNNYKRINFIGYSLGGIIARQSLKHLQRYKDMMNVFISFASPHAGICDTSNPLVKTGIWFLTAFEKKKNLKELNCQTIEDSNMMTMLKLSQCESIKWFKRFVAVSSKEDSFVPYQSSRLEENSLGTMTKSICQNFKKKIKRLERVDVWFDANHCTGPLDKIIGRKSHIQFLENRMFLDCFFAAYANLL